MRWVRVNAGHYETEDGRYMLYRLIGVNPPAWNVEDLMPPEEVVLVDGARTKRDALALLEETIRGT